MKKLSLPLMICGLGLVIGGFVYGASSAGIPYQDPTPELQARYRHHERISKVAMAAGLLSLILGSVLAFRYAAKEEPIQSSTAQRP